MNTPRENADMVSEEDMVRFHNGDTLDSIPVVRLEPGRRDIPWRTVGGVLGTALFVGSIIGLSMGIGARAKDRPVVSAEDPSVIPSDPVTVSPEPVPTVTVTAQTTVVATPTEEEPVEYPPYEGYGETESVYVVSAPATGGDPSVDYCFAYTGEGDVLGASAILLANAPAYQCDDFLFSTHPKDGVGVFETLPYDCSETPGGRTAVVVIRPESGWSPETVYTCLLMNDGA